MSKLIIYKSCGIYHITDEANYESRIQNARAIHQLKEFNSVPEIINYYCTYFGSKPEEFDVVNDEGIRANWYELYKFAEEFFTDDLLPEAKEIVAKFHTEGGNK